jgi:YebC/PmpR family DNA-binding regulatory protein
MPASFLALRKRPQCLGLRYFLKFLKRELYFLLLKNIWKIMGRAFEFRKARKFKRWGQMAKVFTRIGKDIVMAVKEGGPDPDSNSRLRAVIQNAKAANMPKDNVERAIKRASDKDTSDYKEVIFEGYAPHGIAVLVETATDNNNRTVANIRSYFNKHNGNLGTSGSVVFMFDHTCNFRISDDGTDPEELELELIDYGAEEVFKDDDGVLIYASFENFGAIQKFLEENNKEILSSGFERIAQLTKALSKEQEEEVNKLLEKIEEDDDVQNVYHTMKDSIEE